MKPRLTDLQIDNIIKQYKAGDGSDTVAKRFDIHPNTVLKLLKKRGVPTRPLSRFTPEDIEKMKELYTGGQSASQIAEQFGITHGGVLKIFTKEKFERRKAEDTHRKYEINEDFFDTIDTEEKAYFLGILYADGCNNMNHMWSVSLELKDTDREIIEKLSKLIYKDEIVATEQVKTYNREKDGKNSFTKLSINSKHICQKLNDMGMTPLKSLINVYPKDIPEMLHRHFVRGYFDGDGSINNVDKSFVGCKIIGTKEFLEGIREVIGNIEASSNVYHSHAYKTSSDPEMQVKNVYELVFSGNRNIEKFLHWIYDGATIYMERKHKRFDEFVEKMMEINDKIVTGTQGYPQSGLRKSNPEMFEMNKEITTATETLNNKSKYQNNFKQNIRH